MSVTSCGRDRGQVCSHLYLVLVTQEVKPKQAGFDFKFKISQNVGASFPHPTVLVLVEELRRHRRGVPRLASHFITKLAAHRDVDELVLDAFTVQDPHHFGLLGLHLENNNKQKQKHNFSQKTLTTFKPSEFT